MLVIEVKIIAHVNIKDFDDLKTKKGVLRYFFLFTVSSKTLQLTLAPIIFH